MGSKPKGISGSRAATVLGLNPWSTPFEVWQLIKEEQEPGFNAAHGYELPPEVDNAAVRWGTAFEDACIDLAAEAYGARITDREREYLMLGKTSAVGKSEGPPHEMELTCHVDGLVGDATVHEGKTTTDYGWRAKWGEPGTDKIPRHYGVQVQHNMLLSGRNMARVAVLCFPRAPQDWEDEGWRVDDTEAIGDMRLCKYEDGEFKFRLDTRRWAYPLAQMGYFHTYQIEADKELHRMMLDKYDEFWHKYVIPGVPPKTMNIEDIQRRIPNPSGTIVVEDAKVVAWIKEYAGIKAEMGTGGALTKRLEQLKTLILDYAGESVSAVDKDTTDKWILRGMDGDKLASWSKSKKGTFTFRASKHFWAR